MIAGDCTRVGLAEEIKKAVYPAGCRRQSRQTQRTSEGLRRRNARYRRAFRSHVISAELSQSISDEFGRHLFPPAHVEDRVVERFSDAPSESFRVRDTFRTPCTPHEKFCGLLGNERTRGHGADDDASV